jgi:hypothetical protein
MTKLFWRSGRKVDVVGDGTLVSQTVEVSDDDVVVKAVPIKGNGIIDAFNTIVNSFDDSIPVLKLNNIQSAKVNRSKDRLTTVEDGGDYHSLMFSEDVNETDTEPLQNLVDFIKVTLQRTAWCTMIASRNIVYNRDGYLNYDWVV